MAARPLPAPPRWVNDAVRLLLSRVMIGPLAHADRMVPRPAPPLDTP